VLELEAALIYAVLRERPKHECVVGIGAVAEANDTGAGHSVTLARLLRPSSEEPALEGTEELVAGERPDVLGATVLLRDPQVVLEDGIRLLEGVVEFVALEHVVVRSRLVRRPVLRVHRPSDRPDRAFAAFDPYQNTLFGATVVDAGDPTLSESTRGRSSSHPCLR
jgi:hypothetical protein